MNEVSCRATRVLLDAAEREGLPLDDLLSGLGTTASRLRDTDKRVDWTVFARLNENVARIVGSNERLKLVGRELVQRPSYPFLPRIAPYVTSARQLHRSGFRWLAPAMFTNLSFEWRDIDDARAALLIDIPSTYRECAPFFHISVGTLEAVSELGNFGTTHVNASISGRHATFDMTFPPPVRVVERVARRLRTLFDAGSLIRQIDSQQDALTSSYANARRARREMRDILERLPEGVIVHRDGVLVWANDALARLLGYDEPHMLYGRSALDFAHPDDRGIIEARMRSTDPSARPIELRFLRRDGKIAICALEAAREIEFDGLPARLVVGRDVTEERRLQEQLRVADRMASLGTIAAGVAHEINNPLAYVHTSLLVADHALRASANAIASGKTDSKSLDAPARALEALDLARDGVDRVRSIVADLKSFSRPDEETLGAVYVEELIEATLSLAASQVGKRVAVDREYGNVPPVRANRARLGQVFLNLFVNAADAAAETGEGDARIRVRTRTAKDGRVVMEFSDTGPGISPDVASRLFEPFVTTKAVGGGTGLGLAICQRIVTQLGGEIEAESTHAHDGDGSRASDDRHDRDEPAESSQVARGGPPFRTTFRVTLPCATVTSELRREAPSAS